jgi:hypothetical protein
MGYSSFRSNGTKNVLGVLPGPVKRSLRVAAALLFVAVCACAQNPKELLDRADGLADSFNLAKAQTLYKEAEAGFHLAGDLPNELCAKLGQLRYTVQLGYYMATREDLQRILATSMVDNDPHLKIRALEILGNIDLNQNIPAAQNDWTNLLAAAQSIGDARWINRANGYLGIVSGLNGDIGNAGKALFQALSKAEESGDIPGELTFGVWLANGMSTNGMADGALHVLDRVETSAKKNGYADMPVQFSIAKVRALAASHNDDGRAEAKALVQVALADARRQGILGAQTDLLSQAGLMAVDNKDYPTAEASFKKRFVSPNKRLCRVWRQMVFSTYRRSVERSRRTRRRNWRLTKA